MIAVAIRIITPDGRHIVIEERVEHLMFKKICPYLEHEFTTPEPYRVFCCDSHKSMFSRKQNPPC